jgi:RHS repeat-associated protein
MKLSPRIHLLTIALSTLCWNSNIHAQTPTTTKNSVMEQMPRDAMTTLTGSTYLTVQTKINYFNGLGQPLQSLIYRGSGDGLKDILVSTQKYDIYGRAFKNIIPVASATGTGAFSADAETLAKTFYNDQKPFTEIKDFDTSPLNRVQKSYGVGEAWQNASKYVETKYEVEGNGIQLYTINSSNDGASTSGAYPASSLIKTVVVNEQGNPVTEIKDIAGKIIQKTVQNGTEYLSTKFIYDDMERLRFVLPPLINKNFSDNNTTSFTENDAAFQEGIYAYHYDERGRITEKHIAGGGWFRYIYDTNDRLVLENSDKDAAANPNFYRFKKYDIFGREISTGLLFGIGNTPRSQIQTAFDGQIGGYEQRVNIPNYGVLGYTNISFPSGYNVSETDFRSVAYYDDYLWQKETTFNFEPTNAFHTQQTDVNGLLTGILERNVETNAWYKSVNYFDFKSRIIQARSLNHKGNIETADYKFRFNGEILKMRMEHQGIVELSEYDNDNIGRKVKYKHTKDGVSQNICAYEIDQVGRLVQKQFSPSYTINSTQSGTWSNDNIWTLGSKPTQRDLVNIKSGHSITIPANYTAFANILKDEGTLIYQTPNSVLSFGSGNTNALQTIDFKYHIRGNGLRGINLDANNNLTNNRLFSLKFSFEDDGTYYDGNIRKQEWTSSIDNITRSYTYTYDDILRLKSASYGGGKPSENYSLNNVNYDFNGNITALSRNGLNSNNSYGLIDNLTYTYSANSNKIQEVTDASGETASFADVAGSTDYTYNLDGSLASDANKGITIEYNYLNLPKRIVKGGVTILNEYNSSGKKLKETVGSVTTDFLGNLIYKNDVLYQITHEEGRIVNGEYEYNITDHLGNLRVSFRDSSGVAKITQRQDYDPYGSQLQGINYLKTAWKKDEFKYSGKEFIEETGLNDFGWRQQDPVLGRMWGVDRFAEKYFGLSNYQFAGNNAIMNTDVNGDSIVVSTGGATYKYGFTQSGGYGFYDNTGNIYTGNDAYVQSVAGSLAKLGLGKEGRSLIDGLSASKTDIEIKNTAGGNQAIISGMKRNIDWSPKNTTGGPDENGSTQRPVSIGLGHEMAHIEDALSGNYKQGDWINDPIQSVVIPNAEIYSTHRENQLRSEQGLPLRTDYVPNYSGSRILDIKKRMSLYYDSNGNSIFNQQNNTYKTVPKKITPYKY